jgi:c-di-GMP-binding flagellar brake protein YcgR
MKIEQLGLQIASIVQLQKLDDDATWYSVELIGYQKGFGLLISAPRSAGAELSMILRDGQPLNIRLKSAKYAVSFRSQIIEKRLTPFAHIFISVPNNIENVSPLKEVMIKLKQDATLINEDNESRSAQVNVIGISLTEAKMKHETAIAQDGQRVTMTMSFAFAGKRNVVVLEGKIVKVEADPISKEHIMTMAYDELDQSDQILLHAYIYERMLINLNILA